MAPAVSKPVGEDEILGLPKWVWAAIAGGVVTAGIAIYIFAGSDGETKKKPKAKKKPASAGVLSGAEIKEPLAKEKTISSAKSTPSKAAKVTVEDVPEEEDLDKVQKSFDLYL